MKEVTKFIFGVDEATGCSGCLPEKYKESEFNYSWNATMIFHDTVEHYFENQNKYFRKDYAWNIGGEMVAMGGLYYLYDAFTLSKRFGNSSFNCEQMIMNTGKYDLLESGSHGNFSYGYELLCNIPYQRPVQSYMEDFIIEIFNDFKKSKIETFYKEELEHCQKFRNSVTLEKLRRLYRWGYRNAEKRFPNTYHNSYMLNCLLTELEKFTSKPIDLMTEEYESFKVTLFTGKKIDYKIKLKKKYENWRLSNMY